ncbi:MAG: general secretion pathway protein GspK, partial [Opitutales bacterium]|nr:general secretion pathway protein GspK [Opitutales bacterium]
IFILGAILFLSGVIAVVMEYSIVEMKLRAPCAKETSIRQDAYNGLYAAIAELSEYLEIDSGLHSPRQGWGDLLKDGRAMLPKTSKIEARVVDETGKLPLEKLSEEELEALLYEIGFSESECNFIAQKFLDWTDSDDSARIDGAEKEDYDDNDALPPNRPIRSFDELKYIKDLGAYFFLADGQPNEMYEKLISAASLENTGSDVNFNTANELVLRAIYKMDEVKFDANIFDAIAGKTGGISDGVYWLTSAADISSRGANPPLRYVGADAKFLRLEISASRGVAAYRITALCEVSGSSLKITGLYEGFLR